MLIDINKYKTNNLFKIIKVKYHDQGIELHKYVLKQQESYKPCFINYEIVGEKKFYYDIEIILKSSHNNAFQLKIIDTANVNNKGLSYYLDDFKRCFKFEVHPKGNILIQFEYNEGVDSSLEIDKISYSKIEIKSKIISSNCCD